MKTTLLCRCGADLVVTHGGFTMCPHCDQGCPGRQCSRCSLLARTCNDCRKVHINDSRRAQCEHSHDAVGR